MMDFLFFNFFTNEGKKPTSMEWTKEAKERIAKVPFFIRNRVKKRVEEEARQSAQRWSH